MAKKENVKSLREMFEELKEKMNDVESYIDRFEQKRIKTAASKARKALQEIKKDIKPIRDRINEMKKEM
jgi:septation ring formation regulator EzrA